MSFRVSAIARWMHCRRVRSQGIHSIYQVSQWCALTHINQRPIVPPTRRANQLTTLRCNSYCSSTSAAPGIANSPPPHPNTANKESRDNQISLSQETGDEKEPRGIFFNPFTVTLDQLPAHADLLSHSERIADFPHIFATYLFDVLSARETDSGQEGKKNAWWSVHIDRADHYWKTQTSESRQNWLNGFRSPLARAKSVARLLVGSILISPDRILDVLAQLRRIENDFEVRACCLYVTCRFHKERLLKDVDLIRRYDEEVNKLRSATYWPERCMSVALLQPMIWRSNDEKVKELVANLLTKYNFIRGRTATALAEVCLSRKLPNEAFSLLKHLSREQMEREQTKVLGCCSRLLKHDTVVQTAGGLNFHYLSELLEKGLIPNADLYNRIIRRAMQTGYDTVAWDIYDYAKSVQVAIDPKTYVILLRDAFTAGKAARLGEIMSIIHHQEELYDHRDLLIYSMNIVRRIHHSQRHMTVAEGLSHLVALYDRAYIRTSLAKFGFIADQQLTSSDTAKREPDSYALSFTVWAHILCHRHGESALSLWGNIVRLVGEGEQTVVACMKHDLIYNAFIWLHLRRKGTMSTALEVFQYMLEKDLCRPTARTWSILICGFLRHEQRDQAKEIFDLMQLHGFTIQNVCEEYVPWGVSLETLDQRKEDVLNEQSMPDGTDLSWIGESPGLSADAQSTPQLKFWEAIAMEDMLPDPMEPQLAIATS